MLFYNLTHIKRNELVVFGRLENKALKKRIDKVKVSLSQNSMQYFIP